MTYNLTEVWDSNNIVEMFTAVNNLTDPAGYLIYFVLLVLYIIVLVKFYREDMTKTFLATSVMMVIVMSLFYALGWVGFHIMVIPIMLSFIGIFIVLFVG